LISDENILSFCANIYSVFEFDCTDREHKELCPPLHIILCGYADNKRKVRESAFVALNEVMNEESNSDFATQRCERNVFGDMD